VGAQLGQVFAKYEPSSEAEEIPHVDLALGEADFVAGVCRSLFGFPDYELSGSMKLK
jgi:hypothetical protein